jgi:RsiW-degrading membrane proteinase PrsW (M82 family)
MSKRLKVLVGLWGLLWLGIGGLAGLAFLATAALDPWNWERSLWLALLLLAGLAGGGATAYAALRSLFGWRIGPVWLPPPWALAGGFVLALAAGLGLWQARISTAFLMPLFAAAAATLGPLAVASWILRSGGREVKAITTPRGLAGWGLGATASTALAFVLNTLLGGAALLLVIGVSDQVLDLVGDLLDSLAGGLGEELASPVFLLGLVQAAVLAPLVEELVKPLPLLPVLKRLPAARDALLLGVLAGAGFAAVENLLYAATFGDAWSGVLVVRLLGSALHPLGAGLMAVAWWGVRRGEPGAAAHWGRYYGLAVGAHALWNGTCVVAAAIAGAWFQGWEVDLLGVTEGAVLLALLAAEGIGLLAALRAIARRFQPADKAGEEAALLPGLPTDRAIAVWGAICLVVLLPVALGVLRTVW